MASPRMRAPRHVELKRLIRRDVVARIRGCERIVDAHPPTPALCRHSRDSTITRHPSPRAEATLSMDGRLQHSSTLAVWRTRHVGNMRMKLMPTPPHPTPPHPPLRRVASLVWTRRDHVPLCTDHACRCTLGPSPAPHLSPARRTATPTCTRRTTVYILQFCSSVRTTCGCAYRGHRALAYSNCQPQCGVTDVRRHSDRVTSGSFSTSDRIAAHVLLLSVRVYLKWWRLVSFTLACI